MESLFSNLDCNDLTRSLYFLNRVKYPWNAVILTRNRVVHSYLTIDNMIIFDILKNDIKSLAVALDFLSKEELSKYIEDSYEYAFNMVYHPELIDESLEDELNNSVKPT